MFSFKNQKLRIANEVTMIINDSVTLCQSGVRNDETSNSVVARTKANLSMGLSVVMVLVLIGRDRPFFGF